MGEILGRFHPLIVHLPVGILILAFILEITGRTKRYAYLKPVIPFVLQVTIITALLALLTGWVMPKEGIFDERLAGLHFWFSISLTVSVIVLYILHQYKDSKFGKLYFPMFVVAMILLTITGHYGGSLTHGEDHLLSPLNENKQTKVADVNSMIIYADIVEPILKQKCFSCHNEGKQKGGLIMTSFEDLKKGGDEGSVFMPGEVEKSTLIQRLHLPIEDKKHMPPKGKVPLSENEIKLLEWWISEGAGSQNLVGETKKTEDIETILKGYEQSDNPINASDLDIITTAEISDLANSGITIIRQGEESPFVFANLSRDTLLTKSKLKKLKKIAENIIELDLSFSNMNDGLMPHLSSFKNLTKLKLQRTDITSKGLKYLEKLEYLQLLNLYGNAIDDASFNTFNKMTSLNTLYLWQTNVTEDKLAEYKKNKTFVIVSHKTDLSIFGNAQLIPPLITAEETIFNDTLRIDISRNFNNVNVFYTLDGTEPDSTSLKYENPFLIDKTTSVKAISAKDGWVTSEKTEQTFVKTGHKIISAKLASAPNEKYSARGEKSLFDLKKGSERFAEGNWLGFNGENMVATLDLGEVKDISNVTVSALEDTGSYIFFPKGIELTTSEDGKKFGSKESLTIPIAEGPEPAKLKFFVLNFEERKARYIKLNVLGVLKNPDWHPAPGAKSWIFVDEVLVN